MTAPVVFVGADPGGATGAAFALIRPDNRVAWLEGDAALDVDSVRSWLGFYQAPETKVVAAIERVSARPGQGAASTFKFGYGYGTMRAALVSVGPTLLLEPSPIVWKRPLGLKIGANKADSLALARRLFPRHEADLEKSSAHNRADALLMAEWARRAWAKTGA